jgi:GR25 family glycosyltransferase involved in LPS biosynthesis
MFDKVNIAIIEDFDTLNADLVKSVLSYERKKEDEFNALIQPLNDNNVSACMKHYKALSVIAESSNDDDINMVLEDDVLFDDRICMLLESMFQKAIVRNDEIVFMGMPTNKMSGDFDPKNIEFQETNKVCKILPFCDSYIVSKQTASKMVSNFMPITFPTNIQLSYVMKVINAKSYLTVPNIFVDGSKYGSAVSTLTENNTLVFNKDYLTLRNIIGKTSVTQEELTDVINIIQNSSVKNHPDFIHLKAIFLSKLGKNKEAEKTYEDAFNTYVANKCPMSKTSEFLNNYINLYRVLQFSS